MFAFLPVFTVMLIFSPFFFPFVFDYIDGISDYRSRDTLPLRSWPRAEFVLMLFPLMLWKRASFLFPMSPAKKA